MSEDEVWELARAAYQKATSGPTMGMGGPSEEAGFIVGWIDGYGKTTTADALAARLVDTHGALNSLLALVWRDGICIDPALRTQLARPALEAMAKNRVAVDPSDLPIEKGTGLPVTMAFWPEVRVITEELGG